MSDTIAPQSARDRLLSPIGYLRALVANLHYIVAGAVLAGIAGIVATLLMSPQFSSSATLLVSPLPFEDTESAETLMPAPLGVPDYKLLFLSDGTLMRAADKVAALGTWTEDEIEDLKKISGLRKRMELRTEVAQKTANTTLYSPVLVLTATAPTAQHAQDLAKAWAEVSQEVAMEAFEKQKNGVMGFVKDRYEKTKATLEDVDGRIRDMEITWNDELSKAELANKHNRFLDYQEKLIDENIKIETTKKEIEGIELRLKEEPERITLYKSPPMTALFLNQVKGGEKEAPQGYTQEEINDVNLALREKLALKSAELASMEEFTRQIAGQIDQVESEVQVLRQDIATKSYERRMLNLEETPQNRSYDLLASLYEQAKFVDADPFKLGDIKLVAEPVLPDRKSWPPRTLFVLLAGFSGAFVSAALVLLRQLVQSEEFARA